MKNVALAWMEGLCDWLMKAYHALFAFMPFAPVLIAVSAGALSVRLSRRRWIIHTTAFVAMVIALPVFLRIQALLDPTTVLYPVPVMVSLS